MARIKLTRGLWARIDDEDLEWVSMFNWHAAPRSGGRMHAARAIRVGGRQRVIPLAAELLGPAPDGFRFRYRNGDPLDCRRSNVCLEPRSAGRRAEGMGAEASPEGEPQ